MPRVHPEVAVVADADLVVTTLNDPTLISDFGHLPLFQEYSAKKLQGKLKQRAAFDSVFTQQQQLFSPTGPDGKPNPLYPVPDHLLAFQESTEKEMKGANSFVTNCLCCCMPLGATGRCIEINANEYVRDRTSALRPGYKYNNTALELFVNAPKQNRSSQGKLLPCVLFVRGGGISTTAASWQFVARKLASVLNAVVVNIETRLPRFATGPGGMLDIYAALNWTLDQIGENGSPEFRFVDRSRVSLMFQSGGAFMGIALGLELSKRQESSKLKCIFPQVPAVFPRTMFPDEASAGTVPVVRRRHEEVCELQWRCFASAEESPEQNLQGLLPESAWEERDRWPDLFVLGEDARKLLPQVPPFCILTAEFCWLRPQTDEFAQMVKEEGKLLDYVVIPGKAHKEVHCFDQETNEIARRMLDLYG